MEESEELQGPLVQGFINPAPNEQELGSSDGNTDNEEEDEENPNANDTEVIN